jgi:hypothetical protein
VGKGELVVGRFINCTVIEIVFMCLTHWHTQPAVRRAEPSMPLLLILALSVDGMTCLIQFES